VETSGFMEWWEFIKQFFSGDFFYWFYSALVQAFAAMIAVLGMFIVHSIQVRKQDKNEKLEEKRKDIIDMYAKFQNLEKSIMPDVLQKELQLRPDTQMEKVKFEAFKNIQIKNSADPIFVRSREALLGIKKIELEMGEIEDKYKNTISEGRSILVLPFLAFLISVVGLLFANVLKYYVSFGIVITVLFTLFIIYMVWHIKGKSNYLIKTGIDYLSEDELNKQAQIEVEAEIEKS
jgi:hypothetical protein